jgi:hypothetical protein
VIQNQTMVSIVSWAFDVVSIVSLRITKMIWKHLVLYYLILKVLMNSRRGGPRFISFTWVVVSKMFYLLQKGFIRTFCMIYVSKMFGGFSYFIKGLVRFLLFQKVILFHKGLGVPLDGKQNHGSKFDLFELFHKFLMWFQLYHKWIGVSVSLAFSRSKWFGKWVLMYQ